MIVNAGENIHTAKPAREHVSRVRDLALQDRGNYPHPLHASASG